ncbi:arf-GAP with Rho-GAP domain, ANK repeat and PH domain-containing protein 1 isoform X2 [Centruroides vittatus]
METETPPALPPKSKWSTDTAKNKQNKSDISSSPTLSSDFKDIPTNENKKETASRYANVSDFKPIPAPRNSIRPVSEIRTYSSPQKCTAHNSLINLSCGIPNPTYFSMPVKDNDAVCNNFSECKGSYKSTSTKSVCSDTDSIRYLETTKPKLTKSSSLKEKWKPLLKIGQHTLTGKKLEKSKSKSLDHESGDHVYEPYDFHCNKTHTHSYEEVADPYEQKCDIFDLVTFKSPLYGTWIKSDSVKQVELETDSVKYNSLSKETIESSEYDMPLTLNVQSKDYDCPLILKIEGTKKEECSPEDVECNTIYDIPLPEIPPPSYPPPPLPINISNEKTDVTLSQPPVLPPRQQVLPTFPVSTVSSEIKQNSPPIPARSPISSCKIQSDLISITDAKKPLMPVRPAPPVPRSSTTSSVPPIPNKTHPFNQLSSPMNINVIKDCKKYDLNQYDDKFTAFSSTSRSEFSESSNSNVLNFSDKSIYHSGYLFKTGSNRKEFLQRWCILDNKRFSYYMNEKESSFRDSIDVKHMVAIAICSQEKHSCTNCQLELCCFELSTTKEEGRQFLFGARLPSERQEWLKYIYKAMSPLSCHIEEWFIDFKHAGFVYLKEGTAGHWQTAWIVVKGRNLLVSQLEINVIEVVDLRKSMGVVKLTNTNQGCPSVSSSGPLFHIDLPQKAFYIQGYWPIHTESWYQVIHQAWTLPPESYLTDHYMTQENVPVIIDKCLNFISTHGTTVQGIYRIAGSSSKVRKLLECLRQNAWNVHIKSDEYSPHDVTSVLKRFLRELPECIMREKLYLLWVRASEIDHRDERLETYKSLLKQLPDEHYQTLKKLIGHLFSIREHEDKNMMPSMNLAPIFGPTLLYSNLGNSHGFNQTNAMMDVVSDFITHYTWLFEIDPRELEKEKAIQQALQLLREAKIAQRPAGDILVGVYIYNKEWGKCLNVRLTPSMTAEDLCLYAFSHADIKESCEKLAVFEVICNEELERPLHYQEIVLAVTLHWASWAEADAKGNYLLIKHNHICDAIMPLIQTRQPLSMFSELRFADFRSKTFRKFVFEFIGAKLTYYKDARASQPLGQWNVEDITWYIGIESKRSPPTRWGFTFIDRNQTVKRTKDNPYFGRAVCCNTEEEFHKWVATMLNGEHPNNLLPQRPVPDLLM